MATEKATIAVIKAARPSFRKPHDKVAFAIHAAFLAAGYSLAATGRNTFSGDLPPCEEEVGIDGWNELEDSYGFLFFNEAKGAKQRVLAKCHVIGDLLAVDVLDLDGEQEPFHLQINVKDYLLEAADQPRNYGQLYKNFEGLVSSLNWCFLIELAEERFDYGATDYVKQQPSRAHIPVTPLVGSASTVHRQERRIHSRVEPDVVVQRGGREPPGVVYPPIMPLDYNDFPGPPDFGFRPQRAVVRGGGMFVGPNDPHLFLPGVLPDLPGGIVGVPPPAARFDPIGLPDVPPGFEPARFVRGARRPGGGAHPDSSSSDSSSSREGRA